MRKRDDLMKTTILFSNMLGDITSDNCVNECYFNENVSNLLMKYVKDNSNLVFINAPGLKNDYLYYEATVNAFKKLNINFASAIELSNETEISTLTEFPKSDRVYYLMGGNPIAQKEIIEKFNLTQELKNYEGVVIGFCAGAINLSKYSIITTDRDFDIPFYYNGINRVNMVVEPHFEVDESEFYNNRMKELNDFCNKLNEDITAIPDLSCVLINDEIIEYYGEIHFIKKEEK